MFSPRYDYNKGRVRPAGRRVAALSRSNSKRRIATSANSSSGMGGLMGAGGGAMQSYSPVYERAEDPTLAEEFLPTDSQTQNKIFRNIIMYDPVAGPATEYWRDLCFSRYIRLGGLEDDKILQFYEDAIESSNIASHMPWLLNDYLTFGKFVMHMVMDERKGYWTQVIVHDLDFVDIQVSPFPAEDPIINVQPTNEHRDWAVSRDPRIVEQREKYDPEVVQLMAHGDPYPLAPEHTLFLPRKAFATDEYGTSYLTRIIPFKIMEKALIDAEIQAARRRAGPVWVINVPDYYEADQIQEIVDQFFAIEEDAVGGKVAVREGVNVTPLGGGKSDFWTLSDEYDFLRTAKMNALGISDAFISGDANYASMEKVLHVFVEKLRATRAHFTEQVIVNKMLKGLARMHGYVNKPKTQVAHHYRIAKRDISDADLLIPTVEWDRPLEPQADLDYWDLLERLEAKGIPIYRRKWAQAAGYDIDETFENSEVEIEDRAKLYDIQSALAKQAEEAGFSLEGEFQGEQGAIGGGGGDFDFGGGGDEGGFDFGGGDEGGGGGATEGFDFDLGGGIGEGGGAPPATPELTTPEPAGGGEGAGASLEASRFHVTRSTPHLRQAQRWNPEYPDVEEALKRINVWNDHGFTMSMSRRRVAQLVDQIAHKAPEDRNARFLTRFLRSQGLNNVQSGVVQYCAARLGYVQAPHMDAEAIHHLQQMLVDMANEQGMTPGLNKEFELLARVAKVRSKVPITGPKNLASANDKLANNQVLTGVV